MKKTIFKVLLFSTALFFSVNIIQANTDKDPVVTKCPGSGEKCNLDGVGWPVFSKGKDEPAIVIVIE
jgi:hypothetical protein